MGESSFSTDFSHAREQFIGAARAAGAELTTHDYAERGPHGELLSTEVAWLGSPTATKVLVTVSGTHGVEGFCGSGAQVDWLRRGEARRLPDDTAAMLVHAINPFGFAWLRRVTHDNVDLNRNWVDFSQALPPRSEYDAIAAALCPTEWTDASRAQTMATLRAYIGQHGFPAFVKAVSGGQYVHADGLFYGGNSPTAERRTLESVLRERLAQAARIAIIDYHSGLGPIGYGELMVNAPRGSEHYNRARAWYGAAVTPVGDQDSASAAIGGDWISAAPGILRHAEVTAIAIEFGTLEPLQVLDALRADNWLHAHTNPQASWPHPIKTQIRNAFYVDSDVWRGMVLGQSLAATRHAIAGLQS